VGAIPYTGLIILRPKTGLTKAYLRLFVISKAFLGQVEDYLKGSTIHHFGPTHLRQMLISVPPLAEQHAIAAFLDRKLSQIDRQIALIDQLDDLLQQQRKAIIHEAVTGKIDLSAYEPPAEAA
jgi:type I restriction enzyme S subunit